MAASDVRNILLRALFDSEFHNLLTASPEKALQSYTLSDQEKAALMKPGAELYRYLQPGDEPRSALLSDQPPPPPPTTVVVVIVVAITVFVTAVATTAGLQGADIEKFRPLINAIRTSSGPARFDLVKTLINELTKGQ